MNRPKVITFGVLTLAVGFVSCIAWPDGVESAAVAVAMEESIPTAKPVLLFSSPGVTEPRSRTIQITSEVPGTVRAVHVSAGDRIQKGQLLVELDNRTQKAAVAIAEAALAQVKAELERLEQGQRPEERAISKAELRAGEAQLRLAEFDWQRVDKMTQANVASEKEVATARTMLEIARAKRDVAQSNWSLIEAGPRSEDLDKSRAAVLAAEARLEMANSAYDKTLIQSPITGMVIYRFREPGEAVFPEVPAPILSIGDRDQLHIRADVDETDVGRARVGQAVYATAPAYGDKQFTGRVRHIEPTLGRKNFRTGHPSERLDTRILEVVVALDDADELPLELQMTIWFLESPEDSALH